MSAQKPKHNFNLEGLRITNGAVAKLMRASHNAAFTMQEVTKLINAIGKRVKK